MDGLGWMGEGCGWSAMDWRGFIPKKVPHGPHRSSRPHRRSGRLEAALLTEYYGGVVAQRAHSANHYAVHPGNTPDDHPSAEGCMIHSKPHRGCRAQDPGARGYQGWKTADFSHSARCTPYPPPLLPHSTSPPPPFVCVGVLVLPQSGPFTSSSSVEPSRVLGGRVLATAANTALKRSHAGIRMKMVRRNQIRSVIPGKRARSMGHCIAQGHGIARAGPRAPRALRLGNTSCVEPDPRSGDEAQGGASAAATPPLC